MEYEEMYEYLGEFRMEGNISIGKLAEAARMEDYVLRECISANSKLMLGTFATLANGMLKVMEEYDEELKAELKKHYAGFVEAFVECNPEQFDNGQNHYFVQTILRLVDAAENETVSAKVRELFEGKKAPDTGEVLSQINEILPLLNEEGLQEAVKRVKELTYVPEYKL